MEIITHHIEAIRALCVKHKVSKLYVFGSVLTDRFNSDSDIDFLVEFSDVELPEYAENYFDLKDGLKKLLQRNVDLLELKALKNPYLISSIQATQELLYAA